MHRLGGDDRRVFDARCLGGFPVYRLCLLRSVGSIIERNDSDNTQGGSPIQRHGMTLLRSISGADHYVVVTPFSVTATEALDA